MKLSIIIPVHQERDAIGPTVDALEYVLEQAAIPHEIVIVDDHSPDDPSDVLDSLSRRIPAVRSLRNEGPAGYGYAVRAGLDAYAGDAVCIVMADASDDPNDAPRG